MKTRFLPLSSLLLTFLTFCTILSASAQVPSYVPTNGLVGYWPFNGNANDASGSGNNGTVNGATLTTDRHNSPNRAYSFNGNGNYIDLGGAVLNSPTNYSIVGWCKITNSQFGYLFCQGLGGEIQIQNFGNNTFGSWTKLSNGSSIQAEGPINQFEIWSFFASVYNDATSEVLFYWNNTIYSATIPNGVSIAPYQGNANFGKQHNIMDNYFNGSIDDIAIYNRALTADEVLALYNGCNVTPIAIAGSNTPGAFSTSTYTCDNNAGSTYNWTVSNGVIASGQGTNSVSILWGAEGVGSISVVETTADGCVGDAVVFDVNVQCVVSGNAIEGPVGPEAFSNSTYTCNGAANSTYNWTVTNGVIVSGQGTNSVTILWASTGIGNVSVVETTAEGCVGTELTQDVVVVPVNVEEFSSSFSLFPNPATTEINLQTTNDLIGSDLIIFDALGKQIHKQQILSTNTRINTSAFAAGNYVVKVGGVVKRFEVKK